MGFPLLHYVALVVGASFLFLGLFVKALIKVRTTHTRTLPLTHTMPMGSSSSTQSIQKPFRARI